jgi:DNA-binding transcriptional LysR family regulator
MRLTERAGRGVELTPAAQILVGHTDALLARLDAAEADLAALRDQIAGRVTLAAFPSAAASLVPAAWAALADSAPQVRLDLTEMEPEESLPAVLRGETDVAVAHEYDLLPRPLDPLFERRELLDDPVVLAIPADGVLSLAADGPVPLATSPAADGPVPLATLAGHPFLAPRQATSCAEMIQRACARAGFVPRVVARASDFQVLLSLVAAGAGVTLVPRLAARWLPPRVRLVPPADPVTRRVFTVSRRGGDRKPAVRVVLDALSDAAESAAAESPRLHLSQDLAVRDEEPGVLAVRPAQPGPGQAFQVVPGRQAVLDRPVAERRFRQPVSP